VLLRSVNGASDASAAVGEGCRASCSGQADSWLSSDSNSDLPIATDEFDTESKQQEQEQGKSWQAAEVKRFSRGRAAAAGTSCRTGSKFNQQQQQQQEQQQELQGQHTALELQMHEVIAILRRENWSGCIWKC